MRIFVEYLARITSARVHKVLVTKQTDLERERERGNSITDINPRGIMAATTTTARYRGTAISDFGASLFIINPFAIGLWAECPLSLFCVKPINLDHARPSGSSTAASRSNAGAPGRGGNMEHIREARWGAAAKGGRAGSEGEKKSARKNGILYGQPGGESVSGVEPTRRHYGIAEELGRFRWPPRPRVYRSITSPRWWPAFESTSISILSMHNKTFVGSGDAPFWPSRRKTPWESRCFDTRVNMPFVNFSSFIDSGSLTLSADRWFDGEGKYLYIRICRAHHEAINIGFTRERDIYIQRVRCMIPFHMDNSIVVYSKR